MSETPHKSKAAWILSLGFWLALLLAAGLYGAVSLSPKVLAYHEHRRKYVANQVELVKLETRVNYLKRVAEVMENDPQFAKELARTEFGATKAGDERIPVERELTLAAEESPQVPEPDLTPPIYEPVLRVFTDNDVIRRWMLIASAAIVLFAFTFLHPSQAPNMQRAAAGVGQVTGGVGRMFSRYRKGSGYDSNSPDGVG